jgi:hypothetical protein
LNCEIKSFKALKQEQGTENHHVEDEIIIENNIQEQPHVEQITDEIENLDENMQIHGDVLNEHVDVQRVGEQTQIENENHANIIEQPHGEQDVNLNEHHDAINQINLIQEPAIRGAEHKQRRPRTKVKSRYETHVPVWRQKIIVENIARVEMLSKKQSKPRWR